MKILFSWLKEDDKEDHPCFGYILGETKEAVKEVSLINMYKIYVSVKHWYTDVYMYTFI
jgi:hypothetical protein